MKFIGIVGHEAAKFTKSGENEARLTIRRILTHGIEPVTLVSGGCHLGGVDIWAEEVADDLKIPKVIFKPEVLSWNPPGKVGFKARNIEIARQSDILACLAVVRYPDKFKGMKFEACYHCVDGTDHIKGGGCWTMKKARDWGRKTKLYKIENAE